MPAPLARLLLLLALLTSPLPSLADGRPLLWEVWADEGRGSLYLLGSIHVAGPDLYPLSPAIEQAFDRSRWLVMEVDPAQMAPERMVQALISGSDRLCRSLEWQLEPELRSALAGELARRAMAPEDVDGTPPGMLAADLLIARVAELGYKPEYGIERHFEARAAAAGKPVSGLERLEDQVGLLLDWESGLLSLKNTLVSMPELAEAMAAMVAAWRAGDAETLERISIREPLSEHPELAPFYERYFFSRNRRMADQIERLIAAGGGHFVVVGGGHLVGEEGIPALLSARGLNVRRM